MRTFVLILIGLALMALVMRLCKPAQRFAGALWFSGLWLLATLWNLRTGMSHGYSLLEELPFQAAMFAVPALAAVWIAWRTREQRI